MSKRSLRSDILLISIPLSPLTVSVQSLLLFDISFAISSTTYQSPTRVLPRRIKDNCCSYQTLLDIVNMCTFSHFLVYSVSEWTLFPHFFLFFPTSPDDVTVLSAINSDISENSPFLSSSIFRNKEKKSYKQQIFSLKIEWNIPDRLETTTAKSCDLNHCDVDSEE